MRILFLESHPMWIHGLPNGFIDAGHEVLISGPLYKKLIPRLIEQFKPHVYWATEDPTHRSTFTIPYIKATIPDFVFTISADSVPEYLKMGIPSAYLDFGFHQKVHHPSIIPYPIHKSNCALVANAYPKVLKKYPQHFRHCSLDILLSPLLKNNVDVHMYGKEWENMQSILGYKIPPHQTRGSISYLDANKIYSSAEIILGLQNSTKQVTQRTYEIMGSSGFLLTVDTPAMRKIGIHERDFILTNSREETIKYVNHFLQFPEQRYEIQKNGLQAVAPHSYKERAKYIINVLKEKFII
jgi:spore maturation protein CgeB